MSYLKFLQNVALLRHESRPALCYVHMARRRSCNGNVKPVLWPRHTNRQCAESVAEILTLSCKLFHIHIAGIPALFTKTGSTEKYALAQIMFSST